MWCVTVTGLESREGEGVGLVFPSCAVVPSSLRQRNMFPSVVPVESYDDVKYPRVGWRRPLSLAPPPRASSPLCDVSGPWRFVWSTLEDFPSVYLCACDFGARAVSVSLLTTSTPVCSRR